MQRFHQGKRYFYQRSFDSERRFSNDKILGIAKVIDGDTIYINNFKIRFSGIDAPESYYKGKSQICNSLTSGEKIFCGNISKKVLKDKIKNQFVICIPEDIDRYKKTRGPTDLHYSDPR